MLEKLRENWRQFKASEPGCRFQDRYDRQHEQGASPVRRVVTVAAGVALAAAGLVMMVAPGPGVAALVLGVGLIAGASRRVARFLDRAEVGLRRVYRAGRRVWRRLPGVAKAAVVLVLLAAAAAVAYGLYVLFFGPPA